MDCQTQAPKQWLVRRADPVLSTEISRKLSISPAASQILVNTGISSVSEAYSFLNPSLEELFDPFLMKEMDIAVNRILRAIQEKEKICIYGDYDVDGISSTAILHSLLNRLAANFMCYVPDRIDEGYGFNRQAIDQIASKGVSLLISVDCGSTDFAEVAYLNTRNIDVIITDHHELADELPKAVAVINPKIPDCPYPFHELSGAGVALKLAWALAERSRMRSMNPDAFSEYIRESMAFAALGTVADIVPLKNENRILVHYGLKALRKTTHPGLRAIMDITSINTNNPIRTEDIAFKIAPRINAAGRLGRTELALKLFTTDTFKEAYDIADLLDKTNKERQKIGKTIFDEVSGQYEGDESKRTIILTGEGWHKGVIGIVASKIAEKYFRPTVIVSFSDDIGQGSARSIPGFHLFDALTNCATHLMKFGGHAAAAGIQINKKNIESFKAALEKEAADQLEDEDLVPTINIDAELQLPMLTLDLHREISSFGPFGNQNRRPLLLCRNLKIIGSPRLIGRASRHLEFKATSGGKVRKAVGFGMGDRIDELKKIRANCDIVFQLIYNDWGGYPSVEMMVYDFRPGRA